MKRQFGELEEHILKVFKENEKELSVWDVLKELGEKDSYTSIMTVMSRLACKGELKRERQGRSYLYWLPKKKTVKKGLLQRLKEKMFAGKTSAMVTYLLDASEEMSEKELQEIQRKLTTLKGK